LTIIGEGNYWCGCWYSYSTGIVKISTTF